MYEFITENWEVILSLGTSILIYAGVAIPKVIGDNKTRRLLRGINTGIDLSDANNNELSKLLQNVQDALARLEMVEKAVNVDGDALSVELQKTKEEISKLREEIKQHHEIINKKSKMEM